MPSNWKTTTLGSTSGVFDALVELKGKQWLSRGQSEPHGSLIPSIERGALAKLSRHDKLRRERSGIELFRTTAHFFASDGEKGALTDDVIAMMVLRHYGAPSRLLDWSQSPFVAAYFAADGEDSDDGELWSFDHDQYAQKGKAQWRRWPQTTTDGSGDDDKFDAKRTAFMTDLPPDWIVVGFYYPGFPRQDTQSGCYTMAARFDCDHADALKNLLDDGSKHHRYVIPARLKPTIRQRLRDHFGIWRGALFPDSAGAALSASDVILGKSVV